MAPSMSNTGMRHVLLLSPTLRESPPAPPDASNAFDPVMFRSSAPLVSVIRFCSLCAQNATKNLQLRSIWLTSKRSQYTIWPPNDCDPRIRAHKSGLRMQSGGDQCGALPA